MSEPNGKQDTNQEHCKVPSKSSKFQRNCPKKKNEVFFMDLKRSSKPNNMRWTDKCKNRKSIILCHQNVQSLTNKIDELNIILHSNYIEPHFICLSEHHLKETELMKVSLEGYTFATGYCREKSMGGGVCIKKY
jgi:hypothetical protein